MARTETAAAVQALTRASRVLERASTELSLADFRVLSAVAGGEARASRVAERLAIGKPTISATVDSLCRRGLLDRSAVADDQRASRLRLTRSGAAARDRAEAAMADRIEDLCSRTPDPRGCLRALAWLEPAIEERVVERVSEHGGRNAHG